MNTTQSHRVRTLFVGPKEDLRDVLPALGPQLRLDLLVVDGGGDWLELAANDLFDLVFLDLGGVEATLVDGLTRLLPNTGIAVVCASTEEATQALRKGALEAIVRPFDEAHLAARIDRMIEHRAIERLLDERTALLKDARERLTAMERLAAIGHIAANVVHEVNNPASFVLSNLGFVRSAGDQLGGLGRVIDSQGADIATVRASWEALGGQLFASELRSAIEDAHIGALRIKDVVQDMRAMSRDGEILTVYEITEALRTAIRIAGVQSLCSAHIETLIGVKMAVRGSAGRMIQVFINLIVNAAQAIAEIDRPEHTLRICADREENKAIITITDTGPGMAPELVERIFEPFFTTKTAKQGTGLGLSIVRELVAFQGGEVSVTSIQGEGTEFTVSLPIARATATDFPAVTLGPAE